MVNGYLFFLVIIGICIWNFFDIGNVIGDKHLELKREEEQRQKDENAKELIDKIFEIVNRHGGLWRVEFIGSDFKGFKVYSKNNTSATYWFKDLGYEDISGLNISFFTILRKETENRGGLYYPCTRRLGGGPTGGFISYDGGKSYSPEYAECNSVVITEVNLYSREYYRIYEPYTTESKPQNLKEV